MKTTHVWDVALAVGILIALLLLGQMGWHELGGKESPDFWTVIGAVATVAATMVALLVALQTYRDRTKEERVKARLTAARLAPMLLRATATLRAAQLLLEEAVRSDHAPGLYGRAAKLFEQVVELEPSIDELRSIASLQDDCADRIAAAFAQLGMLSKLLSNDPLLAFQDSLKPAERREKSSMYIGMTKKLLRN